MPSDPPEQLVRRLYEHAAVTGQVPCAQYGECVVGERRRHVRTVRSAARARNRPRRGLGWLLVIGFGILIALAARAAAADPLEVAALEDTALRDPEPLDVDAELRDGDVDVDVDERTLAAADAASADELELDASRALDVSTELALAHGGAGLGDARAPRPSWWGRLDLALSWRRRIDNASSADKQRDEVWLLAVWSR